ncbi:MULTISPECIES: hypothetical protein [unclassified Granulicatella]|uniref:hypothetical protein n=1 Tax=unclassified Granulicatella TaxID=2630493 RepID=UPI00066A2A22|nr:MULTISPECIES: hypothetical protein [unclassified Granulicatella]
MKKVLRLVAILFGAFLIVGCSKPKITKEQQDNVAIRIYRNYDIQEIEFLSFTKNESTGSYILNVKINDDENKEISMLISNYNFLNEKDGELLLGPIEEFKEIKRERVLEGDILLSKIKIRYIGGK